MENTKNNNTSILQSIITKAWEDETFKNELIENPEEALAKLTGVQVALPEGKELRVVDQTSENIIYINIPAEPNMEDLELDEEQLEAVAGGSIIPPFINIDLQDVLDTISGKDGRQ